MTTPTQPRVQCSLPHALYALLRDWAEAEGISFSALAGTLLADRIRQARASGEITQAAGDEEDPC